MRLLFALPGFHRYDRGAEVALLSLADALASEGVDVTVMGSGEPRSGPAYYFQHVGSIRRENFERFPVIPPFRNETTWEDASFSMALLAAYDPSDYDAVITCSFPFTHLALRRPSRSKPLQIFVTQNGDWPAFANNSEFRAFRCDGLVCTNPDFLERNQQKWNCALIPNGVDLARFGKEEGARARFGLPEDKPVILMVSAFIKTKRVIDGIRAVAQMEDVFLAVAGDGPLRDEGQALADRLLPGRFKRLNLPATEMPALYAAADCFLHLSLVESFGNVFLEAWASGLPVVGHDTERLRWILGEHSNHLRNTEDQASLISALQAALAQGRNRSSAPQGIERFSWPNIASEYRDFIAKLLETRSSR